MKKHIHKEKTAQKGGILLIRIILFKIMHQYPSGHRDI